MLLHRERLPTATDTTPLTFEFDRVFSPDAEQKEVYAEAEGLVLNALDGYNVCFMVYGPSDSGKSCTMLGDVTYQEDSSVQIENHGLHLLAVEQLFNVSQHRAERYQDTFSLNIVEVCDERLCDMIAGTDIGESRGVADFDIANGRERRNSRASKRSVGGDDEAFSQMSSKSRKLEIRTNNDGDTVVQGLVTISVSSLQDVLNVWKQALATRASRLKEQGVDQKVHEASSHVIATFKVVSTNIVTGAGSHGKIQFVEFAAADMVPQRGGPPKNKSPRSSEMLAPVGNSNEWKYTNKSISTLLDVVSARSQFSRSVPYRNSTVTHLLQDALEGDTKAMMILCVNPDPNHFQETASALRFASKMKRVNIGKATKHFIYSK
jgi:kinesin family protein C2/C3